MVGADGEVVRRRPRLDLLVGAMGDADYHSIGLVIADHPHKLLD